MVPYGEQGFDVYGVIQWVELVQLMTWSAAQRRPTHGHQDSSPLPTPSSSDHGALDTDPRAHPFVPEAPAEFRTRDYDWFTPGRYFRIWARDEDGEDMEIHNKKFILLDTKNIEGPGLLVRRHATEHCKGHKGSFNRTHVLLQNYQPSTSRSSGGTFSRRQTVYMDEGEDDVAENTFVELEHAYNIPFKKYKCEDYGVLTRSSLRELRRLYVDWLKYHWDLD